MIGAVFFVLRKETLDEEWAKCRKAAGNRLLSLEKYATIYDICKAERFGADKHGAAANALPAVFPDMAWVSFESENFGKGEGRRQ